MGKQPAFQFYPGDWFREPGLKRVKLAIRGAWAELLMIMWDENPQGVIKTHIDGYAQMLRIDPLEACNIIYELDENKIADVKYCDDECRDFIQACNNFFLNLSQFCPDLSQKSHLFVTLKNRRMYKAWKIKEYDRLRKQKQRQKRANSSGHGNVRAKSRPYSSSSYSRRGPNGTKTGQEPPKYKDGIKVLKEKGML